MGWVEGEGGDVVIGDVDEGGGLGRSRKCVI